MYQGTTLVVPYRAQEGSGFSPCTMSKPIRHADMSGILSSSRTFFVTTKTGMGRALLQSERNATLLIDVLRTNMKAKKFRVHDFVIMPDHVHLLISVDRDLSIEKAMQLIKGGFSFRLKKEYGYTGEVWQRGFSEVRVNDRESFLQHREYITENPVKAGLVNSAEDFPYCYSYLVRQKSAGAKAQLQSAAVRHD
ncbi:MAG TPA: transposase [Silvibacterium sp.]|nr:transposase [Bryocella sp.]HTY84648.1 transposase [Silvibacterium sp.]